MDSSCQNQPPALILMKKTQNLNSPETCSVFLETSELFFFFFFFDQTELTFCNFLDDDGCEKRLSQVFMVFEFLAENFSQFALSHLFGVSRAENLKP